MYFCPCSCSKPDAENEEDVLIYLPRNLSYAGESYLDRFSVSSAYVHNTKIEKQLLKKDVEEHYLKTGTAACAELLRLEQLQVEKEEEEEKGVRSRERDDTSEDSESEELLGARAMADPGTCSGETSFRGGGGPDTCDDVTLDATMTLPASPSLSIPTSPSPFRPPLTVNIDTGGQEKDQKRHEREPPQSDFDRYVQAVESPDSDMVSEEGIFVNMMDDLDGMEGGNGKSTLSEASDDTCVSGDSMYYSPPELEGPESEEEYRVSLEEAVNKAARSFHPRRRHFQHHHQPQHDDPQTSSSTDPQSGIGSGEGVGEGEDKDDEEEPRVIFYASNDAEEESKDTDSVQDSHSQSHEEQTGDVTGASQDSSVSSQSGGQKSEEEDSKSKPEDSDKQRAEGVPGEEGSEKAESKSTEGAVAGTQQRQDPQTSSSEASQKKGEHLKNLKDLGLKITLNDRPFGPDDKGPLSSSYKDLVSPESPLYEDREFNFPRSELRKSTSLKSSKTPPGTPRRKKVVRFADAMGLDLESVRHILNLESPPKIPASAMKDLQSGLGEDRKEMGTKFIVETFQQPGADLHFRERVVAEKVVLENALIVSGSITGVVRVANISFHKSVRVRFTTNGWATFHDIAASYMLNSNDGATDRFSFTIVPPLDFGPGARLEFAVSFSANGAEYWDNNRGKNYVFECFAKTVPTEAENAWMHFL